MTSIEIRKLIEAKQAEISKCKGEMQELNLQYKDALQIEFEREHSVKSGEKIDTKNGTPLFYEGFIIDAYGSVCVLCHPVKNDGTASKQDRHFSTSDF